MANEIQRRLAMFDPDTARMIRDFVADQISLLTFGKGRIAGRISTPAFIFARINGVAVMQSDQYRHGWIQQRWNHATNVMADMPEPKSGTTTVNWAVNAVDPLMPINASEAVILYPSEDPATGALIYLAVPYVVPRPTQPYQVLTTLEGVRPVWTYMRFT